MNNTILFLFYLILVALNSICFLFDKKSKIVCLISIIFIIIFVVGRRFDGSKIGYDLINYERDYLHDTKSGVIGFDFVQSISKSAGLTFVQFYMIVSFTYLILIFASVKQLKGNFHLFFVAYLIYFILISINQIKNQIAFSILFLFIPFLFSSKKRHIIVFLIGVILSSLFHPSFLVFAIFVFPFLLKKRNKFISISSIIIVLACSAIVLFRLQDEISILLLSLLSLFKLEHRYEKYFETSTNFAPLAIIFIFVLTVFLVRFWYINCKKQKNSLIVLNKTITLDANASYMIFLASSLFLIPLVYNMTFYRFIRDIALIAIVLCSIEINKHFQEKRRRYFVFFVVLAISIGLFIYDIPIKGYWSDYKEHFFEMGY